jgi:hypothetical protein
MARISVSVIDIIQNAALKVGGAPYEGESLKTAKFELNMLVQEILAYEIPLSYLKRFDISVAAAIDSVTLDVSITEILNLVEDNTNTSRFPLQRAGILEFDEIATGSSQTGRPSIFTTHSKSDSVELKLWPKTDAAYTYTAYAEISPEEITDYDESIGVKPVFFPVLIAGLAYRLACNDKMITDEKRMMLRAEWNSKLKMAMDADRERADFVVTPRSRRRR